MPSPRRPRPGDTVTTATDRPNAATPQQIQDWYNMINPVPPPIPEPPNPRPRARPEFQIRFDDLQPAPIPEPQDNRVDGARAIETYRNLLRTYSTGLWTFVEQETERRARDGSTYRTRAQLRDQYMRARGWPSASNLTSAVAATLRDEEHRRIIRETEEGDANPTRLGTTDEPAWKFNYKRGEATPPFFINYQSLEEYQLRLRGSYILFKGSPVFVHAITGSNERPILHVMHDSSPQMFAIRLPEMMEFLDTRPVAPGYVNIPSWNHNCGYLFRTPARCQRQGTCGDNTQLAVGICSDGDSGYGIMRFNRSEAISILADQSEKEFHPRLRQEVVDMFNQRGGATSIKLSRNFAIFCDDHGPQLGFRNRPVGAITPDLKLPDLSKLPSSLHDECRRLNLMK